jgi:hypothetical protein
MERIPESKPVRHVRSDRWTFILPPAMVVLLGLGFGLVPLFQGKLFFYNDNPIEYYAHAQFLGQALKHGVIPHLWPNVGAGLPVIAEGEAHYSPIRILLAAVFNAPAAFMSEIAVCFALAGLGTYLFLRRIGLHPLASSAGALGFMLGSQFVVYVEDMGLLRAGCFLPWAMWLVESSFHRRSSAKVLWIAPLIVALQFLSGNPTFAVITLVAVFCYLILRSAILVFRADGPRQSVVWAGLRVFGIWGLITGLGVGMAAIQVVPTMQHVSQSVRAGGLSFQYAANTSHSQVKDFLQSFFPYMLDVRNVVTAMAGFYDGALLAVAALFCLLRIRRAGAPALCLALSALLAMFISLGASTPVYGLLFRLPFFNGLRFPLRYQFWTSFCFACIGAIGLNQAIEWGGPKIPSPSQLRPFLPVTISLLLGAGLVWRLRPDRPAELMECLLLLSAALGLLFAVYAARSSQLIALLVGVNLLLFIDLSYFRFHSHYAPAVPIADALKRNGVAGWLHQDSDHFRILSLLNLKDVERDHMVRHQNALVGSAPGLWDLYSLGYHGSLELRRYERVYNDLTASLLSGPDQAPKLAGFLGFLQTKYVIALQGRDLGGWGKADEEGGVTVWRNPAFQEGDFLVGQFERENVRDDESIIEQIRSRSIDFRRTAVIDSDQIPELNGLGDRAEVRRLTGGYDEMNFRVTSDRPALLVIPTNFYPGWTATVNGRAARIYRTNWVGMGVLVNPGESSVAMSFSTPGFHTGIGLSMLSVALWIAVSAWSRRKSRFVAI